MDTVSPSRSTQAASLEDMARTLDVAGDFRVLRRLRPRSVFEEAPNRTDIRHGVFVDVETTGLDTETDEVIEIAAVPFRYNSMTGALIDVGAAYAALQEPNRPLDPVITELTGLTDADLAGQRIDIAALETVVAPAAIVIAHNAAFDRKFCERLSTVFKERNWGCSYREVPWKDEGFTSGRLGWIAQEMGLFFDAHRAEQDCRAALDLLARPLPKSGRPGFAHLLETARRATIRIWAEYSPFEMKDTLKKRGYSWSSGDDGRPKAWYIDIPEDSTAAELAWLEEHVYFRQVDLLQTRITARSRYSGRV